MISKISYRDVRARPTIASINMPAFFRKYSKRGIISKGVYELAQRDLQRSTEQEYGNTFYRVAELVSLAIDEEDLSKWVDKAEEIENLLEGEKKDEPFVLWKFSEIRTPIIITRKEEELIRFGEPVRSTSNIIDLSALSPFISSPRPSVSKPWGGVITGGHIIKSVHVVGRDKRQGRVSISRIEGKQIRANLWVRNPNEMPKKVRVEICPETLKICRPSGEVLVTLPSNSKKGLFIKKFEIYLQWIEWIEGFYYMKTKEVSELTIAGKTIPLPHPQYKNKYVRLDFEYGKIRVVSIEDERILHEFELNNQTRIATKKIDGDQIISHVSNTGGLRAKTKVLYLPKAFANQDITIQFDGENIVGLRDKLGNPIDLGALKVTPFYDLNGNLVEIFPVRTRFNWSMMTGKTGFLRLEKRGAKHLFAHGINFPIPKGWKALYVELLQGWPVGYLYYDRIDALPNDPYSDRIWFKRLYVHSEFTKSFEIVREKTWNIFSRSNGAMITHWQISPKTGRIEFRNNRLYLKDNIGDWVILKNVNGEVHYTVFDSPIDDFDASALKRGIWFKIESYFFSYDHTFNS